MLTVEGYETRDIDGLKRDAVLEKRPRTKVTKATSHLELHSIRPSRQNTKSQ